MITSPRGGTSLGSCAAGGPSIKERKQPRAIINDGFMRFLQNDNRDAVESAHPLRRKRGSINLVDKLPLGIAADVHRLDRRRSSRIPPTKRGQHLLRTI